MENKKSKAKSKQAQSSFIIANTAKVNKIIIGLLTIIFITALLLQWTGLMELPGGVLESLIAELAAAAILIVKTRKHTLTMAILFMVILTCTVSSIGGPYIGMIIATVLCVVSLYLNKSILFSFGGLYTITFTVMYYQNYQRFDSGYITKQVLNSFGDIRGAFDKINYYIENELDKVDQVSHIFSQIREQSENISAISQKQLTTTNEMLAATREQYGSVEVICTSINSIRDSSVRLQEVIEHK
ncbi:MAG: hypothetical protein E7243_16515 [Lacrimispora celerecrescens]|nr:hypothetical protein [Lacrimispora celerecrescens]